jgi:hypothetical protein
MGSRGIFWFFVFVSIAALIPVSAHTVSFMVIETGLPQGQGMTEYSNLWENGLLDAFFDAGHIVSNAPVLRLDAPSAKQFPDEAKESLNEANEGGADYFILALLDYQETGGVKLPVLRPRQVSLRVFKTNPFRFVREEKITGAAKIQAGEDFISAKQAAMKILPYLE